MPAALTIAPRAVWFRRDTHHVILLDEARVIRVTDTTPFAIKVTSNCHEMCLFRYRLLLFRYMLLLFRNSMTA